MALFNRGYDRGYGYRGNENERGWGDRAREGWGRLRQQASDWRGHDEYDRDYRGNVRGYGPDATDRGYAGGGWNAGHWNREQWEPRGGYDRDYGYRGGEGGRGEMGRGEWERSRERQQTDYGDPFGDRQRHTPVRGMQGRYQGGRRDWQGGYDRDYSSNPMGYDPNTSYANQQYNRGHGYGYDRTYNRDRGRGWF